MDATNETDWEFCPGKQDNYPCVLSIFQKKKGGTERMSMFL